MADIEGMREFWGPVFDGTFDLTPTTIQSTINFALPSGVTVTRVQQLISVGTISDNTGQALREIGATNATLEFNGGSVGQVAGITQVGSWLVIGSRMGLGSGMFRGDQNPITVIESLSGVLVSRWIGVNILLAGGGEIVNVSGMQHGVRIWFTQDVTVLVDWSASEREQIRQALGITGTKSATASGNLDDVLEDTDEVQGKLPNDNIMGSAVLTSKDDEIDDIKTAVETTIPAQITTHDTDIKALISNVDGDLATHDTDIKALIGTPSVDISTDIAANLSAIQAIQNNTRFTAAVPNPMQKPDAGNKSYRHASNLYDTQGDMEDPDNSEILVRIIKNDGTFITANLFKENGLTTALDNPTDTGTFPVVSGWRAMEREAVGKYFFFYKVASTETEEPLTVEFGWDEAGQVNYQSRATKISDTTGDLEEILVEVTAIGVKVDSGTPSPTIPAQITTHDTDIKALARVEADVPKYMVVPAARSVIDIVGGITAIDTEVPITNASDFPTDGIVIIESEYIIYAGITDNKLQVTDRGAYGSVAATHANGVQVYEVKNYTLRLIVYDNEGNMTDADSLPTIEIIDWDGNQELAPTAMTAIRTGVYGYNHLIPQTDIAENKVFKFVAIKNTISFDRPKLVILLNTPTEEVLSNQLAGGNGDFVLDQDGWYDVNGNLTLWTDDNKGVVTDAVTGAPLDDAWVTAFPVINGLTHFSGRPTAQSRTKPDGSWLMFLDAGTYTFVFEKEGFTIVGDNRVNRTVNP